MKRIDFMSPGKRTGVSIDGEYLVINEGRYYPIELDRIDTPIKAYRWMIHLMCKTWVTREILFKMKCELEDYFGYDLHNYEGS